MRTRPRRLSAIGLAISLCACAWAARASAAPLNQDSTSAPVAPVDEAPASGSVAQAPEEDDHAVLNPTEPDFVVVNLPTTLPLPLHKGNFRLTHRFVGNLRSGSFGRQASNLFGIDQGAIIGFEYRVGVMPHLQAAAYRTNLEKTIQLYAKYDAFHQRRSMPVAVSALVSVEGTNNFQDHYAPALGAVVSRTVAGRFAVYATPMWLGNTAAAIAGAGDRHTGYLGLGGRLRVLPTVTLVGEVIPRIAGYSPSEPEYGFGIEKRAGGHLFQVTFTNALGSTFGQLARGGTANSLYLGFNLARKFF